MGIPRAALAIHSSVPAAGFVGVIPALNELTPDENPPDGPYHFSQLQLIVWSMTLAFFGVFVAIPLRTQVGLAPAMPEPPHCHPVP